MLTIEPGLSRLGHEATPTRQARLPVPMLMQHKDTAMLLLESQRETGAHAWDIAHPGLDRSDPADAMNCVLASVAMINNSMGGDLSQDRIGYEIHKDFWAGPEYDLNYGSGLYAFQTAQALAFALGAEASYHPTGESAEALWEEITYEIDQGRPILATIPGHAFVVTGYREGGAHKIIAINDPWWGSYEADVDVVNWAKHFLISPDSIPVLQEPEIGMNSDGDGIVDFDETARFGTSPNDRRTRRKTTCQDKKDIRGSIFDRAFRIRRHRAACWAATSMTTGWRWKWIRIQTGVAASMAWRTTTSMASSRSRRRGTSTTVMMRVFGERMSWCSTKTESMRLATTITSAFAPTSRSPRTRSKRAGWRAWLRSSTPGPGSSTTTYVRGRIPLIRATTGPSWNGEFQKRPRERGHVLLASRPRRITASRSPWSGTRRARPSRLPLKDGSWGGQGGTLVDGVYDYYADMSSMVTNGEFWQKVHVEQGGASP